MLVIGDSLNNKAEKASSNDVQTGEMKKPCREPLKTLLTE